MAERREFLKTLGFGSGALALGGLNANSATAAPIMGEGQSPESERLYEEIVDFPIDDTHCHPLPPAHSEGRQNHTAAVPGKIISGCISGPKLLPVGRLSALATGRCCYKTRTGSRTRHRSRTEGNHLPFRRKRIRQIYGEGDGTVSRLRPGSQYRHRGPE